MKYLFSLLIIGVFSDAYAQFNTNGTVTSTSNSVSIGTTESYLPLTVQSNYAKTYSTAYNSILELKTNESYSNAPSKLTFYENGSANLANRYYMLQTSDNGIANGGNLTLQGSAGNVGLGIINPQALLHINGSGTSVSPTGTYNGNVVIQGNSGSRSASSGASLEFAIPADVNGGNPWGQARIITVAGNSNSGDATGKLILGTRRWFDKGQGAAWNYGDDLTIDGSGNIGVNTSDTKGYKFAVKGNLHAQQVNVNMIDWADYVFKPTYKLPSLSEVKSYIDQNQRLPEMPSAADVEKNGVNLGDIIKLQTKKIEELTLYLIDLKRENGLLKKQQAQINKSLQGELLQLKQQIGKHNN